MPNLNSYFRQNFSIQHPMKLKMLLVFAQQIIIAIVSSWVICAIITAAGGFPSDPDNPNYLARTDRELEVLDEALWFRFPYPG